MITNPQTTDGSATETLSLYLHLLNLQGEDGHPATDRARLHREIAESIELRASGLDSTALARYVSGEPEIAAAHLNSLRGALDHAHRRAVDPRFNWKPRWLNARQGMRHSHPSIKSYALHHAPPGS